MWLILIVFWGLFLPKVNKYILVFPVKYYLWVCFFVVFLKDLIRNKYDDYLIDLINKMDNIIVTTKTRFMLDNSTNLSKNFIEFIETNCLILVAKNILDDNVWMKSITFQKLKKNNIKIRKNTVPVKFSTDFCFENIIHQTDIKQDLYLCNLNKNCSNYFNNVESGVDYSLTHK